MKDPILDNLSNDLGTLENDKSEGSTQEDIRSGFGGCMHCSCPSFNSAGGDICKCGHYHVSHR